MANAIVAASVPVEIGGVQYWMAPLTDEDYEALDNWLQVRAIRIARESLLDTMSAVERDEQMRQAFETAVQLTWFSPTGVRLMSQLAGLSQYLWQGLKHNHPALTVATVTKWVKDKDKRDLLQDCFDLANNAGLAAKKNDQATGENPGNQSPNGQSTGS